jgi:hypothetical protein
MARRSFQQGSLLQRDARQKLWLARSVERRNLTAEHRTFGDRIAVHNSLAA